ncbi:helix-hairpin-helix domain-containing protein [Aurantibacter sp.]
MKSHFTFSKQERSGIFFLLLLIVIVQIGYFVWVSFSNNYSIDKLQVDTDTQYQIDLLKEKANQKDTVKIYPFNPNFITDYKGYTLGMSVEEINRLHDFRKGNKYLNSKEEFQEITKVSDSLVNKIAPFFKFPVWVKNSSKQKVKDQQKLGGERLKNNIATKENEVLLDLNLATAMDLKAVYGIGEKLSARIIKFRDRLGGFLVEGQLYHVYGLEAEVIDRLLKKFKIKTLPTVNRINVNTAAVDDLTKLVYFNYDIAQEIVNYRDTNGQFMAFDELALVEGFPKDKLEIIQLYLFLKN